uniref:NADH dehydrogenase subunit 6 n=1 Tax=Camallanus lacustris TaxID=378086 RepID=UPI0022FD8858|nr:NADH dehydrogenase subunit 6 [Camallanus lacustris]WAX01713.1 NADH dehydrogenase subunit 6 [Camallanus lacustris]
MLFFCFFLSVVFCFLSYVSWDPMKSSFYSISSLLGLCPLLSMCGHVWYSYYVCMLFLSGIFVVIVYFSSLCFYVYSVAIFFVLFFMLVFFGWDCTLLDFTDLLGLEFSYWACYLSFMVWLVGLMLVFLGFVNFFLNFCGALRSVFVFVFVWFDNNCF